jgi:hypothetical protein
MIRRLTRSITTLSANPAARTAVLTVYYLAILGGVLIVATRGAFVTPSFVYQGF